MTIRNLTRNAKALTVVLIILMMTACKHRQEITVGELQDHIKYLSSDSLKGRFTGSPGDSLAAEYIRNEFRSYGLVPLSGDDFKDSV
jgi:hypothetical protein